MKRAIIIVLDAVGIGELPDADNMATKAVTLLCMLKKHFRHLI